MNLPGSALEFLDAYAGSYAPLEQEPDFPGQEQIEMPLVHVHCFTKEIEPEKGEQDILEVRSVCFTSLHIEADSEVFYLYSERQVT